MAAALTNLPKSDAWVITAEDRSKHDMQFMQLQPVGSYITGDQAKQFFLQSGLTSAMLGHIWKLADLTADGRMDRKEFSIAMYLIKKSLLGFQLPQTLPHSLLVDPLIATSVMGRMVSSMPAAPNYLLPSIPMVGMTSPLGVGPVGLPPYGTVNFNMSAVRPVMIPNLPTPSKMDSVNKDWSISPAQKSKYSQLFQSNDRLNKGFLTGLETKAILSQSGLPQSTLAQIWSIADINKDGNLSSDEFCIAMHLAEIAKSGQSLPLVLPLDLMPPSGQRVRHTSGPSASGSGSQFLGTSGQFFDRSGRSPTALISTSKPEPFSDMLFGMEMDGTSSKSQTIGPITIKTFEDKRKENFEKGQAELERRREMLRDMQKKEMEDRLAFEKSEQEKREKHRMEQELRKQREFEKQREKQRMLEAEKEEQRRKTLEQREAARQETERQRQMEWQRQRRDQLMVEKTREQIQVDQLEGEVGQLKMELSSLDNKKVELRAKIEQVKCSIEDFTTSIESMRESRDATVSRNSQLSSEVERLKQSLPALEQERKMLEKQVCSQTPVQDDNFKAVATVYKQHKGSIEILHSKLKNTEEQKTSLLKGFEQQSQHLNKLKNQVNLLVSENHCLESLMGKKKFEYAKYKTKLEDRTSPIKLAETNPEHDYNGHNAVEFLNVNNITKCLNVTATYNGHTESWRHHSVSNALAENNMRLRKYIVLYQFDARNPDELSLMIGDVVWVSVNQEGVPKNWLKGKLGDKEGLFPESYVSLASDGELAESDDGVSSCMSSEDKSSYYSNLNDSMTRRIQSKVHQPRVCSDTICAPSPTPDLGKDIPDELYVQALYPWRAKKDYHLTFIKDDVIRVTRQQDIWWQGEINGKVGWFPKSYVKLLEVTLKTGGKSADTIQSISSNQSTSCTTFSSLSEVEANPGENYIAIYSYSSTEPGDLTFTVGDVINVFATEGDWWKGMLNGRMGDFPANYVTKWNGDSDSLRETTSVYNDQKEPDLSPNQTYTSIQQNQKGKKPEIASVIAAYEATGPEQLSLQVGQLISVHEKSSSGWWKGELQARGQKRRVGWFPANYVKLLGQSSAHSTPDAMTPTTPGAIFKEIRTSTPIASAIMGTSRASVTVEQVVALYNYEAQHEDELSFFKDSIINVISKDGLDWWQGELNGQIGLLPSNYVCPLSESSNETQNAHSAVDTRFIDVSVPDGLADMEKKRQDHIQELITTEENYMKDLLIVLEVFHKPLMQEKILTEEELNTIFINWKEVKMCNMKLLKAVRVRRKMCGGKPIHMIGDILCENLVHLSPYIRFCSCQLNSAAMLQKKYETDSRFKEAHKKCCQDPRTLGLPMSSFLLKPMQRITKYPLLIEKIFKNTPSGHPDHQNLQEALGKATELCNQVNEGVREKENSDRLEWIQSHVHCDGLAEKITFNSLTNCLGPRKYIRSGTLCKVKSGKELIGILFNDFLLLAQPQRPIGNITSIFTMDMKANVHFKMYRNPIFLNEVMIQKPQDGDTDSTVFNISHVERTYSFRATTTNERDNWVKKIESTSKQYLETERKKKEKAHSAERKRAPVVGRLLIVIVEGSNLTAGENGKSDPYCEVSMGVQEHKTKVIQSTLNPKWNASMQFTIKDLKEDVLCITVYDRDLFSPNDFLGRTEVRIHEILKETRATKGPITRKLLLHEVESGEVLVKLDLQLFGTS